MKSKKTVQKKFFDKKRITALSASLAMGMTTIIPAFAANEINADNAVRKIFRFIFSALLVGGVVMLIMGIKGIVTAVNEGENAPPGAIGKGVGLVLVGIVLGASQWIVKQVFGFDATTFSFFGE